MELLKPLAEKTEKRNAEVQYNLALMYLKGEGITQDYKEAVKWYGKATEQGYANAQYFLGVMYANGNGVKKDKVLAYMWYTIAGANGNELGRENLDKLGKEMSSADIVRDQTLARECMESKYKNCAE